MSAKELCAGIAKKHTIHEETLFAIDKSLEIGLKPLQEYETLEKAQEDEEKFLTSVPHGMPFNGTIKEFRVLSDQVSDGVPITVYKPTQCSHSGNHRLFPWRRTCNGLQKNLRGLCSIDLQDLRCWGHQCGISSPALSWREFGSLQRPVTVTNWVLKNKETVGGCADSKLGVAGDSAGGQISCSVTCQISQLDFQILVYPVTDLHCNLPSFDEFRDIAAFNTKDMETMFSKYGFPLSEVADNPHFNPSARKDVELSPPTLMIFAELDPLIDWGKTYADRLKTAGVQIEEVTFEGVPHGFFTIVQYFSTTAVAAHRLVAEFINHFQR